MRHEGCGEAVRRWRKVNVFTLGTAAATAEEGWNDQRARQGTGTGEGVDKREL